MRLTDILLDDTPPEQPAAKRPENEDITDQTAPFDNVSEVDHDLDNQEGPLQQIAAEALFFDSMQTYGVDKGALEYAHAIGLMGTVSLEALSHGQEEMKTAALEDAKEGIIAKLGSWAEHAMNAFGRATNKVTNTVSRYFKGVSESNQTINKNSGNWGTALKEKIKAHPYATVTAAIGAALALGTVVAVCTGAFPALLGGEGIAAVFPRIATAVRSIKWPFGRFSAVLDKRRILVKMERFKRGMAGFKAAPVDTLKNLGWTQSAVRTATTQLSKLSSMAPNMSRMIKLNFLKDYNSLRRSMRNPSLVKRVGGTLFKLSNYVFLVSSVWAIVKMLFKLIKEVVIGAFRVVKQVFSSIASLFGGGPSSAEPEIKDQPAPT